MIQQIRAAVARTFGKSDQPVRGPVSRVVSTWATASALTNPRDVYKLMDEGYRRNVVAYVCVNEIATSVAQPKLTVETQAGVEVPKTHPLVKLLRRPNPEQSKYAFLEGVVTNLQAAGNAYIHKVRNGMGMPVQLWNVRPDRMKVRLNGDGRVESYIYTVNGKAEPPIPAADIVHVKLYDPLNDYYGLSPLAVAARAIDLDDQSLDYLRAFFVNGAAPSGILKLKEPTEADERERIKQLWRDEYGSASGWHGLLVLDASAEYQEIGSRPEKLRNDSVWGVTETRICAALGVPPILVQLATGLAKSTYSNYREAVKAFWSETLVPMYTRLSEDLTFGLAVDYAGDLEIEFDLSTVEVLQESQAERRTFAIQAWDAMLAKRNEARELAGLPAIPGPEGDEYKAVPPSPFGMPPALGDPKKDAPPKPEQKKDPTPPANEGGDDDTEAPKEGASANLPFSAARVAARRRSS